MHSQTYIYFGYIYIYIQNKYTDILVIASRLKALRGRDRRKSYF